jgi:2-keto-4-pentenoate hydratase
VDVCSTPAARRSVRQPGPIATDQFFARVVEAEFAFLMARDLPAADGASVP